jgi:hypothetical protein
VILNAGGFVKLKALVIVAALGLFQSCSVTGPSPTVPFVMSGLLAVGQGQFIAKDFTISCSNQQDCSLSLQVTSIQPDPQTNVALEIVTFGTDSTGASGCQLANVQASVLTNQGGAGINTSQVSNGRFCAVVVDVGQLHQPETVTVTGQIPG